MVARPRSAWSARVSGARDALRLLIIAVVVGVLSWIPASGRRVPGWERTVFRAVNDLPGFLYWPVWVVMQLGTTFAVGIAVIAALLARRARLAVAFGLAGGSAYVLSNVGKGIVGRGRPPALLTDVHVRGGLVPGNGYPSGHASVAFALASVAWLWLGGWARWAVVLGALIVCLARMYVGAHFPLDVVGGAALGTACGALVTLLL